MQAFLRKKGEPKLGDAHSCARELSRNPLSARAHRHTPAWIPCLQNETSFAVAAASPCNDFNNKHWGNVA